MSNLREQRIRERAYKLYEARGGEDGFALQDWLDAEVQLSEELDEVLNNQPAQPRTRTTTAGRGR